MAPHELSRRADDRRHRRRRIRAGGPSGVGVDDHDQRRRSGRRGDPNPSANGPGSIPAYRALPAKRKGKPPIVVVVHEIFGVHEHIKDVCRRLAKLGYLAVAPELYARQGDVSSITDFKEISSKVVSKVPDAQVMSDLDATVAWAKAAGAATRPASGSPASAGADASSGCTRRTARR